MHPLVALMQLEIHLSRRRRNGGTDCLPTLLRTPAASCRRSLMGMISGTLVLIWTYI